MNFFPAILEYVARELIYMQSFRNIITLHDSISENTYFWRISRVELIEKNKVLVEATADVTWANNVCPDIL